MPTNATFTIEGLEELNVLFKNLGPEITKQFHDITGRFATSILSQMNQRVPVRTGYLKSTIASSVSPNLTELYVTADYAKFVNYGTRRMAARPFFTGPVEEQTPEMITELNDAIANYIAQNVKR